MKILFADPDRDLVWSYKALFELGGSEVVTAYDGAQTINKAFTDKYDEVIISGDLPRVKMREIVKVLNEEGCPVIIMLSGKINSDILLDDVLANAHISLPFLPSELEKLSEEVLSKSSARDALSFGDIDVDVSGYKLCGKTRITNEEINVLSSLIHHKKLDNKKAEPYIHSVNNKLERLNKKTRIRYVMKEGYRLVTEHE